MPSTGSVGIMRIIPTSPLTTQRLALRVYAGSQVAGRPGRTPAAHPCCGAATKHQALAATESEDSAALRVVGVGARHGCRRPRAPRRSRFHAYRRKSSRQVGPAQGGKALIITRATRWPRGVPQMQSIEERLDSSRDNPSVLSSRGHTTWPWRPAPPEDRLLYCPHQTDTTVGRKTKQVCRITRGNSKPTLAVEKTATAQGLLNPFAPRPLRYVAN